MADELKNVLKVAAAIKVITDLDETKKATQAQLEEVKKQTAALEATLQYQKDKAEGEKIDREYAEVMKRQSEEQEENFKREEKHQEIKQDLIRQCLENGINSNYWKIIKVCITRLPHSKKDEVWALVKDAAKIHKLNFLIDNNLEAKHFLSEYFTNNNDDKAFKYFINNTDLGEEALGHSLAAFLAGKASRFNEELEKNISHYLENYTQKQKNNIDINYNGKIFPVDKELRKINELIENTESAIADCAGLKTLICLIATGISSYFLMWSGPNNSEYLVLKAIISIPTIVIPFFMFFGMFGIFAKKKALEEELKHHKEKLNQINQSPYSVKISDQERVKVINEIFELRMQKGLSVKRSKFKAESDLLEFNEMGLSDEDVDLAYRKHSKSA